MSRLPAFPGLTPDDRIWRLDWFGEVAYPGSVRRFAQPSLPAILSPLCCDPSDQDALVLPSATDHHHAREVWVPVAALPFLTIGDLWQGGCRIASPQYQTESFDGLRVQPDTVAFVKAGLAIDDHFLLPLSRHPWHRRHTQSYGVRVDLDGGRHLLIPCLEVIRFYFGSSGNLIQRLFTAPLAAGSLRADKHRDPATGRLHLVLASGLSGVSAADIGRIAESPFAWRPAAGIFASCQKASVLRHLIYPYTGFPFEGVTDLRASGIWLPFGDQERSTYLVYRITSCSHAFPFQSLSYEASDRRAKYSGAGGNAKGGGASAVSRPKNANRFVDADPGTRKAQRRIDFFGPLRFPDLVQKHVWREKIKAIEGADVYLRREDGSVEQVAFGEPDGSGSVAGRDATAGLPDERQALPRFVRLALKAIQASHPESIKPSVKLISLPGHPGPVFSLPVLIDEWGELAEKLIFTLPSGHIRQRRACFAEISFEAGNRRCVLILEGRTESAQPEVLEATKVDALAAAVLCLGLC